MWKLAVGPKHHKILCATSAITLLLCSFVTKNLHALRVEVWSKNGFFSHNASVKAIFALLRSEIIIVFGRFFAREHLLKVYPQQKIMEIQSQNFCSVLIAKKLFFFLGQFEDLVPTLGYIMLLLRGHFSQNQIFPYSKFFLFMLFKTIFGPFWDLGSGTSIQQFWREISIWQKYCSTPYF